MKLSVWGRVSLLAAVGLLMVAGVAIIGARGIASMDDRSREVGVQEQVLRNHLDADMMHDALRGDVLTLLRARTPEEHRVAADSLAAHADQFRQNLEQNNRLAPTAEIAQALADVRPPLDAYIDEAHAVAEATRGGKGSEGEPLLSAFQQSFEKLETEMAQVSKLVEASTVASRERAASAAGSARRALIATGLLAGLLLAAIAWWVTRSIRVPMEALRAALAEVADGDGDLTQRVRIDRDDELGAVAGAANRYMERMQELVRALAGSNASLLTASHGLTVTAAQLAASAEESAAQANLVAGAAGRSPPT